MFSVWCRQSLGRGGGGGASLANKSFVAQK